MKEQLIKFMNKYNLNPENLSNITGYSIDSINSQITGRRNIQDKLILFIKLYDKHEELKKSFNKKLEEINKNYLTSVVFFKHDIQKAVDSFNDEMNYLKQRSQK